MRCVPVNVLQTDRLSLREFSTDDAEFILELLNEPAFIQNIVDRGVRNLDGARDYILNGPVASYRKNGFGLYRVGLKDSDTPIGMCGLVKRETLEDVDIGYAFLARHWSKGYAFESASAVMDYGRGAIGLKRIVAVVSPGNHGSIRVLEKLGLSFERNIQLPGYSGEGLLFTPDAVPSRRPSP